MGLVICTLGLARATVKVGLANLVYNMRRFVWLPTATSAGVDCDPKLRDPDRLTARSSQRHTNLPRNEDPKMINPAPAVLGQKRGFWRCPGFKGHLTSERTRAGAPTVPLPSGDPPRIQKAEP